MMVVRLSLAWRRKYLIYEKKLRARYKSYSMVLGTKYIHDSYSTISCSIFMEKKEKKKKENRNTNTSQFKLRIPAYNWILFFFFLLCTYLLLGPKSWFADCWLVCGTFAVCSSYVRPVNWNKWRRAIWNAHITYKRIRLMPHFYHAEEFLVSARLC